ncbi:hypothetical protein ACA135_01895 [Methanobrevibacter acididurans]|uniref:hypothetical protein n=1 Tax=Methanobrevibacter acididurans TaxID=120963 RepID=UPI0038FD0B73
MMPKFIFAKNQNEMYKTADLLEEKKYKVKSEDKNYILLRKNAYGNILIHIAIILIALFYFNYIIIITILYFLYNFYKNSVVILITTESKDEDGNPLDFIKLEDLEDFYSGPGNQDRDMIEDFKNVIKKSRKK